ncbi:hypothetical protein PSAN_34190 [Pseudomonas antarctica]|uniref:Uncharacterized protein n=1 Tax=Pseudomonas antarctica TaxID=219572 RepID=A0ABQ7A3A1_9PSED|nr:hypothetical protein PSAN_34190 [Pseudomonas antarctica]
MLNNSLDYKVNIRFYFVAKSNVLSKERNTAQNKSLSGCFLPP